MDFIGRENMSGSGEAPVQCLPPVLISSHPGTLEADGPRPSECVAIEDDGGAPTVCNVPTPNPTLDAEEAMSGITDVQRPFSLADDVGLDDDNSSDASILLKCPKGGLLRLGFVSYNLVPCSGTGAWHKLSSYDLMPEVPADFAGTFGSIFSGGGLLLLEKFTKYQRHLVVSNPVSKSQRQLPPMMDFFSKPEILGIYVDFANASYKIPVIQRKFNEKEMDLVVMQEYDSISNSWDFSGQWRNRDLVEPIGAAYVNGTLYFLTYDRQAHLGGNQRVHHIYYLNDFFWEKLELPLGLGHFGFPAIFEHKGKLMLAGGLHGPDLNANGSSRVVRAMYVWEHEWSLMNWKDICNMPSSLLQELYRCPSVALGVPLHCRCTLEVIAGGNFVCVASSNGGLFQCDITKNIWVWLTKPDLANHADENEKILILERCPNMPV